MKDVLFYFDVMFLALIPLIGWVVGRVLRYGRKIVDARLTWDKPVYEQIEDFVTLVIAFALGAVGMLLTGLAYVWWFFNYFVYAYPTFGITAIVRDQPILLIGYMVVFYTMSHMFAWIYKQGHADYHEDEAEPKKEE